MQFFSSLKCSSRHSLQYLSHIFNEPENILLQICLFNNSSKDIQFFVSKIVYIDCQYNWLYDAESQYLFSVFFYRQWSSIECDTPYQDSVLIKILLKYQRSISCFKYTWFKINHKFKDINYNRFIGKFTVSIQYLSMDNLLQL